jgi:DNA-binding transcriptional ArsR family regulator
MMVTQYINTNGDVETMREDQALSAFAALSQEHRLRIVRLLVEAGPEGMAAGALGEKLGAGSSKMSFHLSHLERAGLVRSHRDGRLIIYAVEVATLSGLIAFLLKDCCGGRPEICAPAFSEAEGGVPRTCSGPGTPEHPRMISAGRLPGKSVAEET